MSFFDLISEYWQWGLILLSPFLAFFTARGIYNAICISRAKERLHERDVGYDEEYRHWWGSVLAHKGIREVYCPMSLGADETCYAFFAHVTFNEPGSVPKPHEMSEEMMDGPPMLDDPQGYLGPGFDVACGVSVGLDWTVMDWFPNVTLRDRCTLCITNRFLRLKGGGTDICIDIDEICSVAASCSSVLVGTRTAEVPLLLGSVNGQIVRDVLHILLDSRETEDWQEPPHHSYPDLV